MTTDAVEEVDFFSGDIQIPNSQKGSIQIPGTIVEGLELMHKSSTGHMINGDAMPLNVRCITFVPLSSFCERFKIHYYIMALPS